MSVPKNPTTQELSLADEIISRGTNWAMSAPKRSAKEIWAEFEALRTKIATHASIKSDRETETSID